METYSEDQLFVLDEIKIFPYSNTESLVYNSRRDSVIQLKFVDTENALSCSQFLTFNEHVENILREKPELKQNRQDVQTSLEKMIDSGLMITPADFISEVLKPGKSKIELTSWEQGWVLVICSADRPKMIARLLSTIAPHLQGLSVKPLLILVDDSRDAGASQLNEITIQKFCQSNGLSHEVWDRQARSNYCRLLNEKLPDCGNSIQYLLSPDYHPEELQTYGQARNFGIIRAIGKPLLMIDDDCLINPLEKDSYRSTTGFGFTDRLGEVSSSYDELFILQNKSTVNPLLEHLEVLGKTVDENSQDTEDMLDSVYWKYKTRNILSDMVASGFVGLSVNGIAGALNSRHMDWFFNLDGESLQQAAALLESLEDSSELRIDQATFSGRISNEISRDIPFVGTTICGISALPIIPPMPPTGRNEDLAFGLTTRFLYQKLLSMNFGWVLPHLPIPDRQWKPFAEQQDPEYNATSFYMSLLKKLESNCPYTNPEDRLEYLTNYMANISDEEITILVKDMIYHDSSNTISLIRDSAIKANNYPKYQAGCSRMITYHVEKLKGINEANLSDFGNNLGDLMGSFSQALRDWPVIWSYCKNMGDTTL